MVDNRIELRWNFKRRQKCAFYYFTLTFEWTNHTRQQKLLLIMDHRSWIWVIQEWNNSTNLVVGWFVFSFLYPFHHPQFHLQRVDLRQKAIDCYKPIRTFVIQISIVQNHQSGRDTHIRSVF